VGGPGPPPLLPQYRAGGSGPRWEGHAGLLSTAVSPQLPVVGTRPPGGVDRPRETGHTSGGPPYAGQDQGGDIRGHAGLVFPGFGPNGSGTWHDPKAVNLRCCLRLGRPESVAPPEEAAAPGGWAGLAAPFPEDRPNAPPSWATDQLLAMEGVVRSFRPDSAAGPSGLRPQHLLNCMNSADSASKTGLLVALLTLYTTVSAGRPHPQAAPNLCAASLIPLRTKYGGVRPIKVGEAPWQR